MIRPSCNRHVRRGAFCALALVACVNLLASGELMGQVPPTAREAAAYNGLHAAAHAGDVETMRRMLAARPDLDARDAYGRTPLHVASFARNRAVIPMLVKAGANLNLLENDRYDVVTIASVANDEETLRLLLSLGASAKQVTSRYDGTALIAAAHLGHDGVVRQLIASGAPLDHVNNLHWTAVIESIVLGDGGARHQATLRALLDAGADIRLTDGQGRTPLELAKARGYVDMERMLLTAAKLR